MLPRHTARGVHMTSADFTIADVLAWARTKPADEAYDYCSNGHCAIAQFLIETGRSAAPRVGGNLYDKGAPWQDHNNQRRWIAPAIASAASDLRDETFGAFAKRLEKIAPETPVTGSVWAAVDAYLTDIEDVARERVSA